MGRIVGDLLHSSTLASVNRALQTSSANQTVLLTSLRSSWATMIQVESRVGCGIMFGFIAEYSDVKEMGKYFSDGKVERSCRWVEGMMMVSFLL